MLDHVVHVSCVHVYHHYKWLKYACIDLSCHVHIYCASIEIIYIIHLPSKLWSFHSKPLTLVLTGGGGRGVCYTLRQSHSALHGAIEGWQGLYCHSSLNDRWPTQRVSVYIPGLEFSKYLSLKYSVTWELGTPKGLCKTILNSEVVLFLRASSMSWIGLKGLE